jgi:hypothetical protein
MARQPGSRARPAEREGCTNTRKNGRFLAFLLRFTLFLPFSARIVHQPSHHPFADSLLSQAFPKGGLRLCTKVYGLGGGGRGAVIPAKAGIQLFQYVTKALDPGVRPRIQAFRGRLGDGKKAIFSHVLPGLCTLRSAAPRSRRLSSKFPPARKQITLEACLWYPLPLYAPAEDEREVNGRSRSLSP